MAARRPGPLNVFLNGRFVGDLRPARTRGLEFRYAADWLGWDAAFAVSRSLPLREEAVTGEVVDAVFDNLLPDEATVRRRIATRTGAEGADVLSLLHAIGGDCIGALQFLPPDEDPGRAGRLEARDPEDGEIEALLDGLGNNPLGLDPDGAFRISLAGAQEKTALLWHDGRWKIPLGSTATTHILKPPIRPHPGGLDLSDSVENEHFCLRVLAALGLPVAETRIDTFGTKSVLAVTRFDREWTSDGRLLRRPQEDFCQALGVPSSRKYEGDGGPGFADIVQVLRASDDPAADQRLFVEAIMANWLLGATDVHAKNFSMALRPGGGFRLTPLYDVVSLQPLFDRGGLRRSEMRFALAIGTKRHTILDKIAGRHFEQMERITRLPRGLVRDVAAGLVERSGAALARAKKEEKATVPKVTRKAIVDGYLARLDGLRTWIEG